MGRDGAQRKMKWGRGGRKDDRAHLSTRGHYCPNDDDGKAEASSLAIQLDRGDFTSTLKSSNLNYFFQPV